MQDSGGLTIIILGAIAIVVIGIAIRAVMSSQNPPAWLGFLAKRRAEGKTAKWKEWKDDE